MKDDYGFMVKETNDNGFIINGYTTSYSGQNDNNDGFLLRTDENGILEWLKIYGTDNSEVTGFGYQDHMNCYIFSGEVTDINTQQKTIYLVKTDGSGFSGGAEKTIETATGKLNLMITPIKDLGFFNPTVE